MVWGGECYSSSLLAGLLPRPFPLPSLLFPRRKDHSRWKACHVETVCFVSKTKSRPSQTGGSSSWGRSCPVSSASWFMVAGSPSALVLHLYCTDLLIPVISHAVLFPPPTSALRFPLAPLPAPLCPLIQPKPLLLQEAFPDYPPPFFLPSRVSGTLMCAHLSPPTHPILLSVSVPRPVHRSHWIRCHIAKYLAECLALHADLSNGAALKQSQQKPWGDNEKAHSGSRVQQQALA